MGSSSSKYSRPQSPPWTPRPVCELCGLYYCRCGQCEHESWLAPSPEYPFEATTPLPRNEEMFNTPPPAVGLPPPPPTFIMATLRGTGRAAPGVQLQKLFFTSGNGYIAARARPPRRPAGEPILLLWQTHTMLPVHFREIDGDFRTDWGRDTVYVSSLDARRQRMDLVYPSARTSRHWLSGLGLIGWPWCYPEASVAMPGAGIDHLIVGVDRERRNILHVLGTSATRPSRRHIDKWEFGPAEITHIIASPSGRGVVTLSKDRRCRFTRLDEGPQPDPFDEVYIHAATHPAHLLQVCEAPGQGYHEFVVSTWGPLIARWYWNADIDPITGSNCDTWNLNELLGRSVEPLCISNDGVFMALGTHSGFDIFNIPRLEVVQTGLGQGIYGLTKGAFSNDGRSIVVSTTDNQLHWFQLWGDGWDTYYPADYAPTTPVGYWPGRPVDGIQPEDTQDYDDDEESHGYEYNLDEHLGSRQPSRSVPGYVNSLPGYVEDEYHWN